MGIVYSIACTQCKIIRDVGKMHGLSDDTNTLDKMLDHPTMNPYAMTLIATFLHDHFGHKVVFLNDYDDDLSNLYDPVFGSDYTADTDYWIPR